MGAFPWHVSHDEMWEESHQALKRVYKAHQTSTGVHLGRWVHKQRINKDTLSQDRIAKLNNMGFEWDPAHPFDLRWDQHFEALEKFHTDNGHCRVGKDFVTPNGLKLGQWVIRQAQTQDKIKPDRLARLNDLGFEFADASSL